MRVNLIQHWESNWFNIESQVDSTLKVKLTQHWKSSRLNIESQIYSTIRIKMTQHWKSNWLKYLPGRIIIPPVTQLLRSKWLNFFSRCTARKNWVILTYNVGSNFSSASDSTFTVKMTQFFLLVHWAKKISHFDLKSWVEFKFCQWLNCLSQNDSIFSIGATERKNWVILT